MRTAEKQGYCDKIRLLAEKVREADAIVIGGGSGLSSAAGYNHYHWTSSMEAAFQIYRDYYGFKSPMEGTIIAFLIMKSSGDIIVDISGLYGKPLPVSHIWI